MSRGYRDFSSISVKYGNDSFKYEEFFNCCYPSGASPGSDPCGPPPSISYPRCTCGSPWLTNYRKRKLMDDRRYTWAVDVECYDEGDFLNPNTPKSLSDYWLFNMSNERWWKIKETSGLDPTNPDRKIPLSFWDLGSVTGGIYPNPTKGIPVTKDPNTGELVGGWCGYSDDKLVPKWWIYGCSSVAVFLFELDDAVRPLSQDAPDPLIRRNPVMELSEKLLILDTISSGDYYHRSVAQSAYEKMSKGGYFDSKDWRQDQLQAYRELADRFPGQGYETAVQEME